MKKLVATLLSIAMVATMILWAPGMGMTAEAAETSIYHRDIKFSTVTKSTVIPRVSVQTPAKTAALYAGMTCEQNELGFEVLLDVTDQPTIAATNYIVQYTALANNYKIEANLKFDFKVCRGIFGKTATELAKPIRITAWLPDSFDVTTRDYAAVILKSDGTCEIRGDLDLTPNMLTFDTKYVQHIAIVSAPKGTFDVYKIADPDCLTELVFPVYNSAVHSTVEFTDNWVEGCRCGMITPWATVKADLGNTVTMRFQNWYPVADNALNVTFEKAMKACGGREMTYIDPYLYVNYSEVEQTANPYILTFSVPKNLPAYGEYAVAVCNMDGSVSVYKDIDTTDNTVSVCTNLFRKYAIIWGFEGTLKEVK